MVTQDREPDRIANELRETRARLDRLEEAHRRLETSEQRLRGALDAAFEAVALLRAVRDAEGRILDFEFEYANPEALRLLRRSSEQIIGARLRPVLASHPPAGDRFARFVRVVESGVPEEIGLHDVAGALEGSFRGVAAKLAVDGLALFFHEVTEEKRREAALQASEREHRLLAERYGGIVDALAEIVWVTDPEGKVADDVPTGRRFSGQTVAEVRGYGWLDAVHPDDRPEVLRTIEKSRVAPEPFTLSLRLRTATGEYRWMDGRAVPVFERDGSVREWVGVCVDVDERKRADELLRRREREYVTLAEGAPDVIARVDRDLRVRYVNRAITPLAKIAPADWVGKTVDELGGGESLTRLWKDELRAVIERSRPRTFEYEVPTEEGDTAFLQARLVPELDDAGRVDGVIMVIRDLTELRRKEEALRESESFVELAQKSAHMGVWGIDLDKRTARWSPELFRLYGRDPALPAPNHEEWLSMIHPDDRAAIAQTTQRIMDGEEEQWRLQFRVRHPERGERWLVEVGQRSGRTGAGITLDLTDQKHAEERLRQSAKMEAIGRLAGGLAHDFNNQLQVIRGFASVVARDPGLATRSKEQLREIGKAVDRMGSLTSQLLAFSRQQVLRPESVDLDRAITEDEPMLARLLGSPIRMRVELGLGAKWVKVDRSQLLQVLMNLTINARDAMPRGGEIVIRTALLRVSNGELDDVAAESIAPGTYVELSVDDTGEGIEPELLAHVFEPFFTTKEVGRGTGLGLATVHGIVTQSRGHVWVTSPPGRGTTVRVLLPVTDEAPATARSPALSRGEAQGGRILVVEDERAVRRFLVEALVASGYDVVEADHGRAALAQLEAAHGAVDLVLSDVVMPGMSGSELARELARHHPEVPILWMSGYTREMAFGGGVQAGERPFLQKPVSVSRLVEAVRAAIASKRPAAAAAKRIER